MKESISTEDMEIMKKVYETDKEKNRGALGMVQNTLIDNGLTMYLHTSIGGAIWGACEALRRKGIIIIIFNIVIIVINAV